jgi:hypothetical protein
MWMAVDPWHMSGDDGVGTDAASDTGDRGVRGDQDRTDHRTSGSLFDPGGDRSLLVDAAIGAAVIVVLSMVPFSEVLGGAAGAYLHRERSAAVGAAAGVLAAIPRFLAFVAFLFVVPFGFAVFGGEAAGGGAFFLVVALVLLVLVAAWTVLLSTLGGLVGQWLAREYPEPPW